MAYKTGCFPSTTHQKKKKTLVLIFLEFEDVSESYTASLKGPVSISGHSVLDFRRQSVTELVAVSIPFLFKIMYYRRCGTVAVDRVVK